MSTTADAAVCDVPVPACDPGQPMLVKWVDARYLSGWHDRTEIFNWEADFNEYATCGFFVAVTPRNLLLAEMWSPTGWEKRQAGGINAIPLSAILRCALLEER